MPRGGDRTNRKKLTDVQIESLVKEYKDNGNLYYSPITKIVCSDYRKWIISLTFNLTQDCCNYFLFLIEPPHYSLLSGVPLGRDDFYYWRGKNKWAKYTRKEIKNRLFMSLRKGKKNKPSNKHRLWYQDIKNKEIIKKLRKKQQQSRDVFYNTELGIETRRRTGEKISRTHKNNILKGTFTPAITNTWTHWDAKVFYESKEYKFRSSWECCFFITNPTFEYETIRLPYFNTSKNTNNILVVDFFDKKNNTLYELKPVSHFNVQQDKINVIIEYCKVNNIIFKWINERNILHYLNTEKCMQYCPEQYQKIIKHVKDIKNC